jgi:hypothetical protein
MILLVSYLDMVDAASGRGRETRCAPVNAWPVADTIAAGLPH